MNSEIYEVDINGIGSEPHPTIEVDKEQMNKDTLYKNIIERIYGQQDGFEEDSKLPTTNFQPSELYLNKSKRLLFKKINPAAKIRKVASQIHRWWLQESTQDIRDLLTFIFIHGLLLAAAGLFLLMLIGIDHWMVNLIRGNIALAVVVFISGAGAIYYLMLDINQELNKTWGRTGKIKGR